MMKRTRRWVIALLLLGAAAWGHGMAARRALVVGIGDYRGQEMDLAGPPQDVRLMVHVLTRYLGYRAEDIAVLVDRQATKEAVVEKWRTWLVAGTVSGDSVFFYFSGHGTHVGDFNHDETTGVFEQEDEALVMADASPGLRGTNGLLIDDELDALIGELAGRSITVVIDSCFSGSVTKGIRLPGLARPPRSRRVPKFVRPGAAARMPFLSSVTGVPTDLPLDARTRKRVQRARQNLAVLSACGPAQVAMDMEVPGGRHGAFTWALAEGLRGGADRDGNGAITYRELLAYASRELRTTLELEQDPEYDGARDRLDRVLARVTEHSARRAGPLRDVLRVAVATNDPAYTMSLERHVARLPFVTVQRDVEKGVDIVVVEERVGGRRALVVGFPGQRALASYEAGPVREVGPKIERLLMREWMGEQIRALIQPMPPFRFDVGVFPGRDPSLLPAATGGRLRGKSQRRDARRQYVSGEKIYFHARSERPAWLILLHLQADGKLYLLVPNSDVASPRIGAGATYVFPDPKMEEERHMELVVGPPYGRDMLVGIALDRRVFARDLGIRSAAAEERRKESGHDRRIAVGVDFVRRLSRFLEQEGVTWAEDRIVFETAPSPPGKGFRARVEGAPREEGDHARGLW